jgi:hypothetical protein
MKKPKHQTYGTPEHALLSLLIAIESSEEEYGSTIPKLPTRFTPKETRERVLDYARRVGMEIGR